MIHYLSLGLMIYFAGAAVTCSLMLLGIALGRERPSWFGGYDGRFLAFWLLLWPVSLPVVLWLLATRRGPETGGRP
jgi:predicted permease